MKNLLFFFLAASACAAGQKATVGGPTAPDQSCQVVCDLPCSERQKNLAGRDGAGLCVFDSITHAARWHNADQLKDFIHWMRKQPGGGYPKKVDAMIARYCKEQKVEPPEYLQSTAGDMDVLRKAIQTGRMPCVTYGYSERYHGPVAHMVNLVHLDDQWACVLDNNFVKENELEWMPVKEFERRWKMGQGGGWAVVLLTPAPWPVPCNR